MFTWGRGGGGREGVELRTQSTVRGCGSSTWEIMLQRLPLEAKNAFQIENGSLGLIETPHEQ